MAAPLLAKTRSPLGYSQSWLDNLRRLDPDLDLMWSLGKLPRIEPHWVVVQRCHYGTGYRHVWHILDEQNKCREPGSYDLLVVARMDKNNNPSVVDEFIRRFDEEIDRPSVECDVERAIDDVCYEHRERCAQTDRKLRAAL